MAALINRRCVLCWPGLYLRLGRVNKLINMLFESGISSPGLELCLSVCSWEVSTDDNIVGVNHYRISIFSNPYFCSTLLLFLTRRTSEVYKQVQCCARGARVPCSRTRCNENRNLTAYISLVRTEMKVNFKISSQIIFLTNTVLLT